MSVLLVEYRVELESSTRYGRLALEASFNEAASCLDAGTARLAELQKIWPTASSIEVVNVTPL
jgi:hypothetical protein